MEIVERIIPEIEKEKDIVNYNCHIERYNFVKNYVANKDVLDVACGSGYGSEMITQFGCKKVCGVDVSMDAIQYAKEHYANDKIKFIIGEAENVKSYGEFDVVVSFETIEHLIEYKKFLLEVKNSMKSEGLFIISSPVRESGTFDSKPINPFHLQEWNEIEFIQLLYKYFNKIEWYVQYYNFRNMWMPFNRIIFKYITKIIGFFPIKSWNVINNNVLYQYEVKKPFNSKFNLIIPLYIVAVCKI